MGLKMDRSSGLATMNVFEMIVVDSCHIYGCYSRTLSLFLLGAFQRPTLHSCAFFYVYVQDMEVLFVLFQTIS
ncbi:hypothetical protein PAMP_012742 [Pampus punctatissimus]